MTLKTHSQGLVPVPVGSIPEAGVWGKVEGSFGCMRHERLGLGNPHSCGEVWTAGTVVGTTGLIGYCTD